MRLIDHVYGICLPYLVMLEVNVLPEAALPAVAGAVLEDKVVAILGPHVRPPLEVGEKAIKSLNIEGGDASYWLPFIGGRLASCIFT